MMVLVNRMVAGSPRLCMKTTHLHMTSCVRSTRHISGFLSWPSYTIAWRKQNKKQHMNRLIQYLCMHAKSLSLSLSGFGSGALQKWKTVSSFGCPLKVDNCQQHYILSSKEDLSLCVHGTKPQWAKIFPGKRPQLHCAHL